MRIGVASAAFARFRFALHAEDLVDVDPGSLRGTAPDATVCPILRKERR
ncbi:MAG: hypothetical protein ACRDJV_12635 [Actinomycetota bacterium]